MPELASGVLLQFTEPSDSIRQFGPTVSEIMNLTLFTDCNDILKHWQIHWTFCPICGAMYLSGVLVHKSYKKQELN